MITKFQIETQTITSEGTLAAAKKTPEGWYPQIPVFIFNTDSRNGYPYHAESVTEALTSPGKYFYEACVDGSARGEYGHPDFSKCLNAQQVLMRMGWIDKTRMSHALSNGKIIDPGKGGVCFTADIKPMGAHGKWLAMELDDPTMNATFSVRTLLKRMPDYHRNPRNPKMVDNIPTFDSVDLQGIKGASKRGQILDQFTLEGFRGDLLEAESIDVDMRQVDMHTVTEIMTTESVTAQYLLDSLKADLIQVKRKNVIIGTFEDGDRSIHTSKGRASLIHKLYHGARS